MKRIDFENGKITENILQAALPMLVAQLLSLLYNIVDRIYIARIPEVGTAALGAVGLCFPIIVIITAFSNLFGRTSGSGGSGNASQYRVLFIDRLRPGSDVHWPLLRPADSGAVRCV